MNSLHRGPQPLHDDPIPAAMHLTASLGAGPIISVCDKQHLPRSPEASQEALPQEPCKFAGLGGKADRAILPAIVSPAHSRIRAFATPLTARPIGIYTSATAINAAASVRAKKQHISPPVDNHIAVQRARKR